MYVCIYIYIPSKAIAAWLYVFWMQWKTKTVSSVAEGHIKALV